MNSGIGTSILRAVNIALALLLLLPIGFCAWINSAQLATGFPTGLTYKRVLAYEQQSGLIEGCVFIAYELTRPSVALLSQRDNSVLRSVRLGGYGDRNVYSSWHRTPLQTDKSGLYTRKRIHFFDEARDRYLSALGASGGCNNPHPEIVDAERLLAEPGNYVSVSANDEGLSILSPARRLAVFLYFG